MNRIKSMEEHYSVLQWSAYITSVPYRNHKVCKPFIKGIHKKLLIKWMKFNKHSDIWINSPAQLCEVEEEHRRARWSTATRVFTVLLWSEVCWGAVLKHTNDLFSCQSGCSRNCVSLTFGLVGQLVHLLNNSFNAAFSFNLSSVDFSFIKYPLLLLSLAVDRIGVMWGWGAWTKQPQLKFQLPPHYRWRLWRSTNTSEKVTAISVRA